jgi:F0F1-type ATP synthase membrane subunit c/vacuolar-type H+-ATPase subunit K
MESTTDLQKELRKTVIVAWAMAASILVYPLVAEIIRMQHQPFNGLAPESAPPKDTFFIGALIAFIGIRLVRNAILKGAGSDPQSRLNRLRTATIVSLVMTDIPALLGLVLFLMTGNTQDFYVMVALSLVGVVLYFPKLNHWEVWMRRRTV